MMPGKQPPQLDRGREFAPLFINGADRSLVLLGDNEHRRSMGTYVGLWLGEKASPSATVLRGVAI